MPLSHFVVFRQNNEAVILGTVLMTLLESIDGLSLQKLLSLTTITSRASGDAKKGILITDKNHLGF